MNWEAMLWYWCGFGALQVFIEATARGIETAHEHAEARVRGWKNDRASVAHRVLLHYCSLVLLGPIVPWMVIIGVAFRPRATRIAKLKDAQRRLDAQKAVENEDMPMSDAAPSRASIGSGGLSALLKGP